MNRTDLLNSINNNIDYIKNHKKNNVYLDLNNIDYTINYDLDYDYIFVSLEKENIQNINIINYKTYKDITIIDLLELKNYDLNILELIKDILIIIKENI